MTDAGTAARLAGPVGRRVVARRDDLLELLHRHRVRNPRIFGSVARGEDHEGSDVDLLVEFAQGTSLFDILSLQDELEELLGVRVDLASEQGVKRHLHRTVSRDLVEL